MGLLIRDDRQMKALTGLSQAQLAFPVRGSNNGTCAIKRNFGR